MLNDVIMCFDVCFVVAYSLCSQSCLSEAVNSTELGLCCTSISCSFVLFTDVILYFSDNVTVVVCRTMLFVIITVTLKSHLGFVIVG